MSIAVHPQPDLLSIQRKNLVEIEYPTSDGKPMAETERHRDLMINHILMLQTRYEQDPNVHVSGNNFIYYQEGDPKKCISPDVYFVSGVPKKERESYKVWEEKERTPSFAFEFTSKSTRQEDKGQKFQIYEQELKTQELVFFDPTGDYLKPPLQGHRLEDGKYVRVELKNGRLYSEVLGLELVAEGRNLRLYDPVKEEWLLTPQEQRERANKEAQRAEEQTQRAEEQTQRAEEATQRAENEARRAENEARRADDAIRRAQAEADARSASEAEVERLRAVIEALRQQKP